MNFLRFRKLGVLLMLACACASPATGSALLARALMVGLHESPHRHSVSVVAEEGHLHLVFSHDARSEHDHAPLPPGESMRTSFSGGDHVFHLAVADTASSRRSPLDSLPPPVLLVALRPPLDAPDVLPPSPETLARGADQLRTVVLRL